MTIYSNYLGNGNGNNVEGVINDGVGCGLISTISCEIPQNTQKMPSWNVGSIKGTSNKIAETIARRKIDLCHVQKVCTMERCFSKVFNRKKF